MNRLLALLLTAISLAACDRVVYSPDRSIAITNTKILAHAGGGWYDEANTLKGCKYGLSTLDGIECDIQRSADNNLWLSHSNILTACGEFESASFSALKSSHIVQIDSCLGAETDIAQLDSVLKYMSENYPDKTISLDVKPWMPTTLSGLNILNEMNELGQKIIELTLQYRLENRVKVESESVEFLKYIGSRTDAIETYLLSFGDFELAVSRALYGKLSGISYKHGYGELVTKEKIDQIHQKGLKIQLWTVNSPAEIEEALLMGPDYLQTDNVTFLVP